MGSLKIEPEVAFRNVEPTEAIRYQIREAISGLEAIYDRLTSCRITVELPERRRRTGSLYHVRVDLTLPGDEIVIRRVPPRHRANEELTEAVGEAFDRARRALLEVVRRRRGEIKTHREMREGRVARLLPDYGFIESSDGLDVYFHRNSVVRGGFERLREGAPVRFRLEQGDEGPQAAVVRVVGEPAPAR